MLARVLGCSLGEYVTVYGARCYPTWLLADGHQATQGLVTDVTLHTTHL